MVTTLLARVAGLVLFLFGLGVFSQTGYLLIVTLLFGGDASAVAPAAGPDTEGGHGIVGFRDGVFPDWIRTVCPTG